LESPMKGRASTKKARVCEEEEARGAVRRATRVGGQRNQKEDMEEDKGQKILVERSLTAGGESDSDDDAPEEVSLSAAKSGAVAERKAEAMTLKAAADKRKEANRAKELQIARSRDAKAALSAEVLAAVAREEGGRRQAREDEARAKEELAARQAKQKVVKAPGRPKLVHKQGFTLEKLSSSQLLNPASARVSSSSEALSMLAAHFGKHRRHDYNSVHDRSKRPSPHFAQRR